MLEIGLVGLPNVGKSTLFNALTSAGAEVSNYPFTTIDGQRGVVPVPDERLGLLAATLEPDEAVPAAVAFVDIAGLVEGASQGEGLGNRFLGEIRSVDAIAHVVRCFDDPDVAHVAGSVDPVRDARVIATELLLADLEVLQGAVAKQRKAWQTDPRGTDAERRRSERWLAALEAGTPLRELDPEPSDIAEQKGLGLLTGRPLLYVANVGEADDREAIEAELEQELGAPVVALTARLEAELAELEPDESALMAAELGVGRSGLERLAERAFDLLGLIRFYTVVGGAKLRAWAIPRGTPAPMAAGAVHSDMREGFIRAKVVHADELLEAGSFAVLADRGAVRTEGKAYEITDGDVVEFLFKAP